MHGPTCIFWAKLTPFSRQRLVRAAPEAAARACAVAADGGDTLAHAAVKAGAVELLHPLTWRGLDPERTFNTAGQSVLQVAFGCENQRSVGWAKLYGTYAGRYKLAPGEPSPGASLPLRGNPGIQTFIS